MIADTCKGQRDARHGLCIAILQPTFLPWLGWFDIVDRVDLLVILDDVAFAKRSWQQRNRLRTLRGLEYATVPVFTTGLWGQPIHEVKIADSRFREKLERMVTANYARAPYYELLFDSFREALLGAASTGKLVDLNVGLVDWICRMLGVQTPRQTSSSLGANGRRGEYMAALCEELGANNYLSPAGSEDYLLEDRASFEKRNQKVWLHEYEHPEYRQVFHPFMPYASTLDLIFNEGGRALEIIRSGRRLPRPLSVADRGVGDDYVSY